MYVVFMVLSKSVGSDMIIPVMVREQYEMLSLTFHLV